MTPEYLPPETEQAICDAACQALGAFCPVLVYTPRIPALGPVTVQLVLSDEQWPAWQKHQHAIARAVRAAVPETHACEVRVLHSSEADP